jgi:sialate O-acetylesterase
MKIKNGTAILTFDHFGSGLQAKNSQLKGFKIAGSNQRFYDAIATIEKAKVMVSATEVKMPVAIRYGWEDYPECSLYNKEGLPASPFRTDDWNN